jgi:hypothetical protein
MTNRVKRRQTRLWSGWRQQFQPGDILVEENKPDKFDVATGAQKLAVRTAIQALIEFNGIDETLALMTRW